MKFNLLSCRKQEKAEDSIQKLTNEFNAKIEKVLEVKETEIMAV